MNREYNVTITETLSKTVTIEADSQAEAEQKVSDAWHRGDYILDADNFVGMEISSADPFTELSYREMKDMFTHANLTGHEPVSGYIVFDASSFNKPYSEQSRTYRISSANKAFDPRMGGYSIFGSCLDGSDSNLRMEQYIRGPDAWKIERCYVDTEEYRELLTTPSLSGKEQHTR